MVGRAQRATWLERWRSKQSVRQTQRNNYKTQGNTKQSNRTHRNKMRHAIKERRFPFHVESGSCWMVLEAKTRPRRSQDTLATMLKLKLDFGTILVGFSPQLGLKNRPKSSKNRGQDAFDFYVYFLMVFWSLWDRFLKVFCYENGANLASNSLKNQR